MDNQVELLRRRFEREKSARKEAEKIIEGISRELYTKNQELDRMVAFERQARNEADTLRMALEAFTKKLNRDEILTHLERYLTDLILQDSWAIYLVEEEGFCLKSMHGDLRGKILGRVIAPDVLLNDLKNSSNPILISDNENGVISSEWGVHSDIRTWMAVPISSLGRNIGCLTFESRQKDAFSESTAKLVQALAYEVAIALENARLFQEVERLSTIDPLTGLLNRRKFDEIAQLEFERSRRYDIPLSAIMMDIDHFKQVNDTYGHAAGDQVLIQTASVCKRQIRLTDICARFGGEEFCFLLPQTESNAACVFAEHLRKAITELQFRASGQEFNISASFGVAGRLGSNDSVENLLEHSDQALYEAKKNGRNKVLIWNTK
jgi:diguanylate cyclase (GGDEF)-like protein